MKKFIAMALSALVGIFGYTIVDSTIEARVSSLESQVESLNEQISRYHSHTTEAEKTTVIAETTVPDCSETTEQTTKKDVTYPDETVNLLWPTVSNSVITAGYPTYESGEPHWGIDICVCDESGTVDTYGKPIYASQSGKVIVAKNDNGWNMGFGNYCIIDHGNGIQTLYAKAKEITVSEGDTVKAGEHIGAIGDSGNTTGPHLHFEVRIANEDGSVSRVNPLDYLKAPQN